MCEVPDKKTRPYLLTILAVLFILAFSVNAAADAARKAAQDTIKESMDALWAGQDFSPRLQQKQQALKKMLEKGDVVKNDLEDIIGKAVLSLINRQKTSRYALHKMPERINELLSPHLEWEGFREILWNAAASAVEESSQVVVSIGTMAPVGTPWISVPEKIIADIEKLSRNKLTIRIYSGGVMGEDTDILDKMAAGQLDGCGCTALGILTATPEISVFFLPGLFHSYSETDYILTRFRKKKDDAFEKKGYILAALIDTGNLYFFSRNSISSLADLRRSRALNWFGSVETTIYDELGVSAMPVPVTEVVTALSTGMADTILAPAAWMLGMQAYEHVNCFIKEPLLYSPSAVFVSTEMGGRLKKQFGLSDIYYHNIQEVLIFEFSSFETEWKNLGRRYEARCLEAFTDRIGIKAVTLPPEDREAIEQANRKVWARLAGTIYPESLLEDILNALEEYRKHRQ